jgi:hypothetical protein
MRFRALLAIPCAALRLALTWEGGQAVDGEGRVRVRVSGNGRSRVVVVVVVQVKSGLGRSRRTGDGQVPACTCSSRAALRQAAPPPPASTAPLKDDIAWGQKQRRSLTAACCCARHSATSPGNDAPCDTEHVGCSLLLLQNTLFTRLHGARWVANTIEHAERHLGPNSPFTVSPWIRRPCQPRAHIDRRRARTH